MLTPSSVFVSKSVLKLTIDITLFIIGGERERAPHLIVRRKFICPSVRLSVCPVWLTEHARENNTCSLLARL